MAALRAERQREALGLRVVFGHHAARFHVVGDEALVDDLDADDARRPREGGVGGFLAAAMMGEGDIGAEFGIDERRAGRDGLPRAGHRRQAVIVDVDPFRRRLRRLDRIGDDEGDGVADMAGDIGDEQRPQRKEPLRARHDGRELLRRRAGITGDVGATEDQAHARRGPRRFEPSDGNACMRHGRAHDDGVQRPGRRVVIGEMTAACDQRRVFLAPDRGAHAEFARRRIPSCRGIAHADPAALGRLLDRSHATTRS